MHQYDHTPKSKKKQRKVVPVDKRRCRDDCEPGDVVLYDDGRRAIVTSRLAGSVFGRYLDGEEAGEFCELDDAPLVLETKGTG